MGVGEQVDPLGGGGEQHPVAGLAGTDRQADGQVGLAGARGSVEQCRNTRVTQRPQRRDVGVVGQRAGVGSAAR